MVINFLTYRLLSILIGILYPLYQTYKSIKYQYFDQYHSLLCYWILFSLFQIYELIFDQLISLILPFYYEIKLFFIFWLTYKNVSELLFHHFILICLNKYENDIDYLFNNTINRLTEVFLKFILFIINQQRTMTKAEQVENHGDHIRLKTNFASQSRRLNSTQRK
ncbi:unnamed protein product [Rotaria magnacalcarata]|uniref:Receptor expression-enhancing protein n=1 Tax=Rotaria magnacalcarata TaxID=392030 RepID=A0A818ZXE1_9BILA|nr:unnamed protein product [Rotaria magnacalcarata]CAF1406346.1 unnamed protein product [Rotaria magnacalcarata]CAF1978713.1 unnamed protein product [Rotaria magnacalcarata]CAF2027327.1 unnamed protein product [Rotaria magnacalcarata]CAF2154295.1 unnamed protein product [Rotaria magnacalcarata]